MGVPPEGPACTSSFFGWGRNWLRGAVYHPGVADSLTGGGGECWGVSAAGVVRGEGTEFAWPDVGELGSYVWVVCRDGVFFPAGYLNWVLFCLFKRRSVCVGSWRGGLSRVGVDRREL